MTAPSATRATQLPAGWTRRGDADSAMPADHRFLTFDGPRGDAVTWSPDLLAYEAHQCYSERDGAQAWRCMGWYATSRAAMTALDVFAQAAADA